eukprot:6472787-Amphidinium_carterae.1
MLLLRIIGFEMPSRVSNVILARAVHRRENCNDLSFDFPYLNDLSFDFAYLFIAFVCIQCAAQISYMLPTTILGVIALTAIGRHCSQPTKSHIAVQVWANAHWPHVVSPNPLLDLVAQRCDTSDLAVSGDISLLARDGARLRVDMSHSTGIHGDMSHKGELSTDTKSMAPQLREIISICS